MGALLKHLPETETRKKSAGRASKPAKLNQYKRDPGSPSERMRASSDYDAGTGYAPFFHAFLADWGRLSSGHIADMMFLATLSKSLGRGVKKGDPRPTRTLPIAKADLAALVNPKNPPLRSVERELVRWQQEKIADVKDEGKGLVSIELLYRAWEALPDFKSDIIEMPSTADDDAPELKDEDEAKPGNQRVTGKSAVRIPAGKLSKVFPVSAGVKTFRYKAAGPVDLDVTCVIQAGELVVTSRLPEAWAQKLENLKSSSHVSNNLDSPPRHGRREEAANTGRKPKTVDHPRAGELCNLFDEFLAKSAARLLSGDSESLKAACEAVGDCEHDYLVKFVVNRASSPIKKPSLAALICGEALQSWKASKVLTAAGARRSTGCKTCGAPKGHVSKLTGRCSLCDGDKQKAARLLKDAGLSDAEIREIQS